MNLRQLRYFQTVAELKSVTKAADRLHIAQPAVTRHVQELQGELGVRLIERDGRGIALTPAGLHLARKLSFILSEIDSLVAELRSIEKTDEPIRLGIPTALSALVAPTLVDALRQSSGGTLQVLDGWSGFIVEWLRSGELDVGIIYDHHPAGSSDLVVEPLALEPQFLIARHDDELARRDVISLREAASLPMILPGPRHGLRHFIEAQCRTMCCPIEPIMAIDSMTTIKSLVELKQGYSIMGQCETGSNMPAALTAIKIAGPELNRVLYISWPRRNNPSGLDGIVVTTIKAAIAQVVESGDWGTAFIGSLPAAH